jgi:glycosyltransferase involved in cell wall biosynthesis
MPTVLEDGRSGFVHTDPQRLIDGAGELLRDHALAMRLGAAGQAVARERFSIDRFIANWNRALADVVDLPRYSGSRGESRHDREAVTS